MTTSSIKLSEPKKLNLSVYRGDSGNFRISVKDNDLQPIDISSATWRSLIKFKTDDPDILSEFLIELVVDDPSSVDVVLTAENSALLTDNCVYDVEMTFNGKVMTLVSGSIQVRQDVSRS